ncbi:MAG: hypothetical protein ACI935_000285, partial [Moritella dasanensis]
QLENQHYVAIFEKGITIICILRLILVFKLASELAF